MMFEQRLHYNFIYGSLYSLVSPDILKRKKSLCYCCCTRMTVSGLCCLYNKVWQCGGSVEVHPCARIAHIERAHKPYTEDLTSHVRRNALRVAEVWMDEFKSHVYMAWNIPQEVSHQERRHENQLL